MAFKERYENNKILLLTDKKICKANRDLFKEFFEYQEEKLKRINDNQFLDEPSYKTLFGYINKFKNINEWFKNKAWKDLTIEDIKKVYRDLEDGKILNRSGKRFEDRRGYYNKVFKAKPFDMAGKTKEVREALELFTDRRRKDVCFCNKENFNKIVSVVSNPYHLALLWLSFDIGENINTLLSLNVSNFKRQKNEETKEDEYIVWLPQSRLKRSRKERSELTLYPETTKYLDIILEGKKAQDKVFSFQYRQALKFFDSAVKKSGAICEPNGDKPSWKDLRSGMACYLFKEFKWTADDINLRLGHSITSRELESYFSYLAGQSKSVKKLHYNNNLNKVQQELEEIKQREKMWQIRNENLSNDVKQLQENEKIRDEKFKVLVAKLFKKIKD